jgi:uncharacterized lipoprotein YehR (DUF1307 family)
MVETEQKTIKENKMKTKCVVLVVALVIAFGVMMTITGCGNEESSKTTKTTTVEKTTNK